MDESSQKLFDEIMRKEPTGLTPSDVAFLKARESYLTPDQRERYAEVLAGAPDAGSPTDTDGAPEPKSKSKKKDS
jgi:hypothetical protein